MFGRLLTKVRGSGSTPAHHSSHRALLRRALSRGGKAALDAIIVPSSRRAGAVLHAGELARDLDAALIVLASHSAKGVEIRARLASLNLRRLYVVDVPPDLADRLLAFRTSKLLEREKMDRGADVSAKRNLGLAVARLAGLRRVMFLDDDMKIPRSGDLKVAAGLLGANDAVGLRLGGFPDNSVVCHANRETGGEQDTFVGGGALLVATDRVMSFFPNVYNEDWFFLLDESRIRSVAVTGEALQKTYDPYADPERARLEEFGDVLAEGIFALQDVGKRIDDADAQYWQAFIRQRRILIEKVHHRTRRIWKIDRRKAERVRQSLRAAHDQLTNRITPQLCVEYVQAWQHDLAEWKSFCAGLDQGVSIEAAIMRFGLNWVVPFSDPVSNVVSDPVSDPVPVGSTEPAPQSPQPAAAVPAVAPCPA